MRTIIILLCDFESSEGRQKKKEGERNGYGEMEGEEGDKNKRERLTGH